VTARAELRAGGCGHWKACFVSRSSSMGRPLRRARCAAHACRTARARAQARARQGRDYSARTRLSACACLASDVTSGDPVAPQLALEPRVAHSASSRESMQCTALSCAAIHARKGLADLQQVGVGGLRVAAAQPCAALEVRETFQGVPDPAELDLARRGHSKTSTGRWPGQRAPNRLGCLAGVLARVRLAFAFRGPRARLRTLTLASRHYLRPALLVTR
jgi:hypothetical protein